MKKTYRIGSRSSPLALKQVEEVIEGLKRVKPGIVLEMISMDTYGDRDKSTPISDIEGTDFFTKDLDEALINKEIDIAVHSAKDLPDDLMKGLVIAGMMGPIDTHDVLVSKSGLKLAELPIGAKIGTSSVRRKTQLAEYRDDLKLVDIRGNIGERIDQIEDKDTELDAIVIAAAGLIRLSMEDKITERIPFDILKPHPMQGTLAIMTREDDTELIKIVSKLRVRSA